MDSRWCRMEVWNGDVNYKCRLLVWTIGVEWKCIRYVDICMRSITD